MLISDFVLLVYVLGMEYLDPKKKSNFVGKILMDALLTALCILMLKQSPSFNPQALQLSDPPSLYMLLCYNLLYPSSDLTCLDYILLCYACIPREFITSYQAL